MKRTALAIMIAILGSLFLVSPLAHAAPGFTSSHSVTFGVGSYDYELGGVCNDGGDNTCGTIHATLGNPTPSMRSDRYQGQNRGNIVVEITPPAGCDLTAADFDILEAYTNNDSTYWALATYDGAVRTIQTSGQTTHTNSVWYNKTWSGLVYNPDLIEVYLEAQTSSYFSLLLDNIDFTCAYLPDAPTLITPSNGSTIYDPTPFFDWSVPSGSPTSYEIEVDNNNDFSSPVIDGTSTLSSYSPGANLSNATYYWRVRGVNADGNGPWSSSWTFMLSYITPGGSGAGTRPVHSSQTQSDPADPAGGDTIIITEDFARVYASANGTIESVTETLTGWKVVINTTAGNVLTYNGLNTVYAEADDTVSEGCLLGETGYSTQRKTKEDGTVSNELTFEWLDANGDPVDWTGFDDPTGSAACGVRQRTENCINNNPNLNRKGSGYKVKVTNSDQLKTDGWITLVQGDMLSQDLTGLTPGATYYITIAGKTKYPASLRVGITNNTPTDIEITEVGDFQEEVTIEAAEASGIPDIWQLYVEAIKVKAEGIHLDFFCLHADTGTVATAPRDCYFPDQYFQKTDVWSLTGGATLISDWSLLDPLSGGYVRIPLNGQIADDITIRSETDQSWEYVLTVWARLAPPGSVTDLANSGDDATLSARVDTGGGDETIGDLTIDRYGVFYAYKQAFTIPANEEWAGNFELETTAIDAAPDYVEVNQICLNPKTGVWPGTYDQDAITPVNSGCVACSIPSGLNVWEWLAWLGCLWRSLWYCAVAPEVAKLVGGIFSVIDNISMAVIWGLAAISNLGNFLWKTAVWQGKRLGDLFAFIGSDLWLKLIGKDFMKDLYDWFSLGKLLFAAGKELLDMLLSLPARIFKTIASFIKMIYTIWMTFKTAFNGAEPVTAVFIYPDCTTYPTDGELYPLCWGQKKIDEVLFDNPWLYAGLYTVTLGLLGFGMLYWLFKRLKREIPFINSPESEA